jgi:hypothetical protein
VDAKKGSILNIWVSTTNRFVDGQFFCGQLADENRNVFVDEAHFCSPSNTSFVYNCVFRLQTVCRRGIFCRRGANCRLGPFCRLAPSCRLGAFCRFNERSLDTGRSSKTARRGCAMGRHVRAEVGWERAFGQFGRRSRLKSSAKGGRHTARSKDTSSGDTPPDGPSGPERSSALRRTQTMTEGTGSAL